MSDAYIHKNINTEKDTSGCRYDCMYLWLYSPELNPVEHLWSVCKSKIRRETTFGRGYPSVKSMLFVH